MTKKVGKALFHMFIHIAFFNLLDNSLRKQPTFSDATTSKEGGKNFCHYPNVGSVPDWLKIYFNQS